MTLFDLALRLTGREYGNEITKQEEEAAKDAGLVVVFGASDDLIEFRGAIHDERSGPGSIYLNRKGEFLDDEDMQIYTGMNYPYKEIQSHWCPPGAQSSWVLGANIPHAYFVIFEDKEPYCVGIIFSMDDLKTEQEKELLT
ncbi:hypothetical protein [Spirosoma sp.]|uniref:hypothetical protein n=1 Tax=Spirosoma sp. TaxID=1899569 RepID=UPI00260CBC83|nr:hypothetical protein [Spirosoma sp.]MCX6217674.1 hypothetical protein [Spirosoma sp.]